MNGTFIQGFELDDVHVDAPWHANSIILPALFAAAEHIGKRKDTARIDGSSLLLSTIVGFEMGSRVGRALRGPDMLSRGWHSVSIREQASRRVSSESDLFLSRAQYSGLQGRRPRCQSSYIYLLAKSKTHWEQHARRPVA